MNNKFASCVLLSILLGSVEPVIGETKLYKYKKFDQLFSNHLLVDNVENQKNINSKNTNLDIDIYKNKKRFYTPRYIRLFFSDLIAEIEKKNIDQNNIANEVDIIADEQRRNGTKFIAEGNVIIRTKNAVLKTNKFTYDEKLKIMNIDGEVAFKTKTQYLKAKNIEYDFLNKKGFIIDAFGSLNLQSLTNVFNYEIEDHLNENFNEDLEIKNVILQGSLNLNVNNDLLPSQNVENKSGKPVARRRFFSKRIDINDNIWSSKIVFLTNDPFNKPQLVMKNKDFKLSVIDDEIIINTKWSSFNFDDKLSLPVGPQNINPGSTNESSWGAGYDKNKYDGFYFYRNSNTFYFDKKKNTQIDFTTIFNLQRAIYGKTESFPAKNDSIIGTNIKQDANFLDYFALKTNFKSSIENWNFNLEAQTNSLDFEKLDKIVEINSDLKKRFYEKNSSNFNEFAEIRLFGAYNDKTSNGSLGDITVNSAYGLRYNFNSIRKTENNTKSNLASLTYGRYSAPERTNANTLETRNRLNLSLKQINEYKLWNPKLKEFIDKDNKYRPYNISQGLYWLTEVNTDFFRYDNGDKQDLLLIKTGPKLIMGNFKNDFFDYTEFSLYPRFKFNNGKSPFSFDQIVDNKVIELNIKQQIYKSLALKLNAAINLDDDISDDEKLINPTINISLNRRAYDVSLYYNFDSEVGGLEFNIFSFNFDGLGEKF